MATVTHAGTAVWTTTAGNKTVPATSGFAVAVGDLIVVVAPATGAATSAVTDNNPDGLGAYTKIGVSRTGFSTAGDLSVWVRNALIGSATNTTWTITQTSSTGGGADVFRVSGMTRTGAAAVRQSSGQSSGTSGTTPAPVMGSAVLTGNPVIGAVANGTSPATLTPRASPAYTEATDLGYSSPTSGMETMFISSGETATTITWGSTSGSTFASIVVELDTTGPETSPALELSGFTISGPGSADTINSVTVAVTEHQSSASMSACTFELWDYSGTLSFRSASSDNSLSGGAATSVTPALPSGWQPGDVVLAVIRTGTASNIPSQPAGWTALTAGDSNSGGFTARPYYRVMQSGDTAPAFTFSAATWAYSLSAWTPAAGYAAAAPVCSAVNAVTTATSGASFPVNAVTAAAGGEISAILTAARRSAAGAVTVTFTPPSGWSVPSGGETDYSDASNNGRIAATAYQGGQGPGSVAPGNESITDSGSGTWTASTYQVLLAAAPVQIGTTQTGTASTSTSNVSSATFTGVTYSQLAALRVRVYGHSGSAGAGGTESVDAVSLVVNYTPAAASPLPVLRAPPPPPAWRPLPPQVITGPAPGSGPSAGADSGHAAEAASVTVIAAALPVLVAAEVLEFRALLPGSRVLPVLQVPGSGPSAGTDSGHGAEAGTVSATLTTADTGHGTEAASVHAALAGTDTGHGAEASPSSIRVAGADTGHGAEAGSVHAALARADTGHGAEASPAVVRIAGTDTGHGTEAGSVHATVAGSDTGHATEYGAVPVGHDSGHGTEAGSVHASLGTGDTGHGAEAGSVAAPLSSADTGHGTETSASVRLAKADTGHGTEGTPGIRFSGTDSGHGTEGSSVHAAAAGTDTGHGTEGSSVHAALASADTGHAAEAGSSSGGSVPKSSADAAKATESAFYYITGSPDSGQAAEGPVPAIRVRGTDSGHAADAPLTAWPGSRDSGTAADKPAKAWPAADDSARATEGSKPFRFARADSAAAADVTHEIGIWTYIPVNVRLLGTHWRITGMDEQGREVTVAQGEHLTGDVLKFAERARGARVVRLVSSGDHASAGERLVRVPVAVTCWVQPAVAVSVQVSEVPVSEVGERARN